MKIRSCFAVLATLCAFALPTAARADLSFGPGLPSLAGCASINTVNKTQKWIWVTIYDLSQSIHLDYGWVQPGGSREWRSGNYSCAGVYHVRAEVKSSGFETASPGGGNIFDTRMQLTGQSHIVYLHSNVYQVRGAGYADANTAFWLDTNQDATNLTPVGTVEPAVLTVANSTAMPMRVRVDPVRAVAQQYPPTPTPDMALPCVLPGASWTNSSGSWVGAATVSVSSVDSCSAPAAPHVDQQVTLNFGTTVRLALAPGFAVTHTYYGEHLKFENGAPHAVQFVLDGLPDKSPSIAAGGSSAQIAVAAGSLKITPVARARCDDTSAGVALAPIPFSVYKGGGAVLNFRYTLVQQ